LESNQSKDALLNRLEWLGLSSISGHRKRGKFFWSLKMCSPKGNIVSSRGCNPRCEGQMTDRPWRGRTSPGNCVQPFQGWESL